MILDTEDTSFEIELDLVPSDPVVIYYDYADIRFVPTSTGKTKYFDPVGDVFELSTAGPTTWVDGPTPPNDRREVMWLALHALQAYKIKFWLNDDGTRYLIRSFTLSQGDNLQYKNRTWTVVDFCGNKIFAEETCGLSVSPPPPPGPPPPPPLPPSPPPSLGTGCSACAETADCYRVFITGFDGQLAPFNGDFILQRSGGEGSLPYVKADCGWSSRPIPVTESYLADYALRWRLIVPESGGFTLELSASSTGMAQSGAVFASYTQLSGSPSAGFCCADCPEDGGIIGNAPTIATDPVTLTPYATTGPSSLTLEPIGCTASDDCTGAPSQFKVTLSNILGSAAPSYSTYPDCSDLLGEFTLDSVGGSLSGVGTAPSCVWRSDPIEPLTTYLGQNVVLELTYTDDDTIYLAPHTWMLRLIVGPGATTFAIEWKGPVHDGPAWDNAGANVMHLTGVAGTPFPYMITRFCWNPPTYATVEPV